MSKGLGSFQTAVLGFLLARTGGDRLAHDVFLASGWHDIRTVGRELKGLLATREAGLWEMLWEARFCRAIRTLQSRGMISFPSYFELRDSPTVKKLIRTEDGFWLDGRWWGNARQRRFAHLNGKITDNLNAYDEGRALVQRLAEFERAEDARIAAKVDRTKGE